MFGTYRNKRRPILREQELLAVNRYLPGAREDHPVLGAVVMHLHGECATRLDGNAVNVKAGVCTTTSQRPTDGRFRGDVYIRCAGCSSGTQRPFHILGAIFVHHQHRVLGADNHRVLNANRCHQLFVTVDVAVLAVVYPASPFNTFPSSSFGLTSHSADQEPTSLQSASSPTTTASAVFSITA